MRTSLLAAGTALALLVPVPGHAAQAALTTYDVISLEIAYTTVMARYYKPVGAATLLGGAHDGILAYLRGRGIAAPAIPAVSAHPDRWRAESEIDRDVALAVARYGTRVRTTDLVQSTIAGELAALHDPYTVLLTTNAYKKFVGFLDGTKHGGIGAELDVDPRTHAVRVVDVFSGGPAERAGLQAGDVITAIDDAPPASHTPDGVALQLRGAPGTAVRITFLRDGASRPPLTLVRADVAAPDVLARALPDGIGYVRVRSFGAQAAQQFDGALTALRGAGVHAYVLDLRADGGGYRDAAIAIASHLVDGTIVTTRERGAAPHAFTAAPAVKLGAPFALLVDRDTASASEIVAGAVQDARAGTLVGEKTFGKGLVQELFPMPGGAAIKVTTASYVTPHGRDIDRVGITPDVTVPEPDGAAVGQPGRDPQLDRALELLGATPPSATK